MKITTSVESVLHTLLDNGMQRMLWYPQSIQHLWFTEQKPAFYKIPELHFLKINMWLDLQKPVLSSMTESSIFLSQTQRHINTLSNFTAKMKKSCVVCFCWLLLPSPLVIRTNGLGSSWSSGGKVEYWVSLLSFVVLNEDLCCLLAIILAISRYISLVHLPLTFFINPSPAIRPPASFPLLSLPDTTIWEPTSVEKLSIRVGNLFLVYLARWWF